MWLEQNERGGRGNRPIVQAPRPQGGALGASRRLKEGDSSGTDCLLGPALLGNLSKRFHLCGPHFPCLQNGEEKSCPSPRSSEIR